MEKTVLKLLAGSLIILLLPLSVFAQTALVTGMVTDASTGEGLWGANVSLVGTDFGSATRQDGSFRIEKVTAGTYTVKATFIGYTEQTREVTLTAGKTTRINFSLKAEAIVGSAISVLADRAKPRETPVAYSTVTKADMEARLGSQDIPLSLNTTPSVYSTMQGGGAGDARINIRGFNQRNVAVMINGVPVNDMENGWVYWSNWDGVGDATSSIQIQRGLSAVNLAAPSIGGTMNVITDPAAMSAGARFKQEIGNDGFMKSTLSFNSGLINGKYAVNGAIVRKTGDGIIDKTWTDAWAYYFGAAYQINKDNRLELYALGAPQRHGQNLYKQNIAAYSHEFAKNLDDYDPAGLDKYKEASSGLKYNENWNQVSSSYTGKQYWNGKERERYSADFINERENYYHKPLVNLNWYTNLSEKLALYSTAYYSGGTGGGTGTYGSMVWDYSGPSRIVDWDKTIQINSGATDSKGNAKTAGRSLGVLRNSTNNQWTIGLISKANYKWNDEVSSSFGIDWRTAKIDHYREVRDLLGGSYYIDLNRDGSPRSDFWSANEVNRGLGDKIDYDFSNTVDWFGFYGQSEYTNGVISGYGMAGYSMIKYSYTNYFRKTSDGSELKANTDWIDGFQVKGGSSYRLTENVDVFGNAGYVSKVPIFDEVMDDRTGTQADDPQNEKYTSLEGGVNFTGLDGTLALKGNFYYTIWKDKANSVSIQNQDGSEGIIFLQGLDLFHSGLEFEAAYQPISLFRLDLGASIGNWKYTDNVVGTYKDYSLGAGQEQVKTTYYVKDLKSGDAPQTQLAITGSLYPVEGMMAQVILRHYRNHYAAWEATGRTNPDDFTQSWQAPNYSVMDFHASYRLPLNISGFGVQLFAHVFNMLDSEYIQDATDNSAYNGLDRDHDADDAEVYFGLPRTFNVGLSISY